MSNKYLFGPVPSRRLGISLGIDLVPPKTCTMNCVYCECGETTCLQTDRREFYPTDEILAEIDAYLGDHPKLDFLTFSGAGEPTLHSGIGRIAGHIKEHYPEYKICLLTNGTLLGGEELIKELEKVDLVIPSLDAVTAEQFERVNRPAPGLTVDALIDGLVKFRKACDCELWLEIFVVSGINDSDADLEKFADAVKRIAPDKVQLNTLDRPGCVDWIIPAGEDSCKRFIAALEPLAQVEAVGKFKYDKAGAENAVPENLDRQLIDLVSRRPMTVDDLCHLLNLPDDIVKKHVKSLVLKGKLFADNRERGTFYRSFQVD